MVDFSTASTSRSGLICVPDCCTVVPGMYAERQSVWQEVEFDQRVPRQELFLVEVGSYQVVYAFLIEASHRSSQLQEVDQCFLLDQTVRQPT